MNKKPTEDYDINYLYANHQNYENAAGVDYRGSYA